MINVYFSVTWQSSKEGPFASHTDLGKVLSQGFSPPSHPWNPLDDADGGAVHEQTSAGLLTAAARILPEGTAYVTHKLEGSFQ